MNKVDRKFIITMLLISKKELREIEKQAKEEGNEIVVIRSKTENPFICLRNMKSGKLF